MSLVPSVTETLLAWGVDVVACTRFCEQPDILHVGGTKDPDISAIVALAPDLVVVDREENRRDDALALELAGIALHVTHVTSLAEVEPMLAALAEAVGVVAPQTLSPVPPLAARCSGVVVIWRRPWMVLGADTYGSTLLASLGVGTPLGATVGRGQRYPTVDLAGIARSGPDLIVLPSEPYPFTARHVPEVRASVPGARVLLVDGRDLLWWGVRTSAARQRLAEVLADPSS